MGENFRTTQVLVRISSGIPQAAGVGRRAQGDAGQQLPGSGAASFGQVRWGAIAQGVEPEIPRTTGAACAPRGHAFKPANAGADRRAVR